MINDGCVAAGALLQHVAFEIEGFALRVKGWVNRRKLTESCDSKNSVLRKVILADFEFFRWPLYLFFERLFNNRV